MDQRLREEIQRRAKFRCEYCLWPGSHTRLRFQIDHILSEQHSGRTEEGNLAFSCAHCNRHKGPNVAGIDPQTSQLTPLFNPRRNRWSEHFRWEGAKIVGTSAIGRVTVHVLAMNKPLVVLHRTILMEQGIYLPSSESV